MAAKILKSIGEVVHRSTYRYLLPEKLESTEQKTTQGAFDASVAIKCGSRATVGDFDGFGAVETLECDLYEDDTTDVA